MNFREFFDAVDALCKERNIKREDMYDKISVALCTAASHSCGRKESIHCEFDFDNDDIRLYRRFEVVYSLGEDEEYDGTKETVENAQKFKPGCIAGDVVVLPIKIEDFGRIAAQTVKHILRQGIREIEHGQVLEEFMAKSQDIVQAKVVKIDSVTGNLVLKIGNGEATLPKTEQIPGEKFYMDQMIKVYIVEVKDTDRGPRAMISRSHPGFVKKLFENEVSEIVDGAVTIRSIAREAGSRTKISVYSSDPDIDPVGACIGQRGARVNGIVNELGGEKIDIVKYSDDPVKYISSALAPSDIVDVEIINDALRTCQVTVPATQLSLAIGNKGQNVRLAARLTGWKIDIKSDNTIVQNSDGEYQL